jgi:hypothetical protein
MGLKTAAIVLGLVLLVVGVLGFVPSAAPEQMLFGIFHVNTAHSIVHLLSGAVGLLCGFGSTAAARAFFRTFGAVYGLVAVLGLVQGDGYLLGLVSNNMPDVWLHFAIAVTSLLLGFAPSRRPAHVRASSSS